ncbi:MAG: FAD:protein transferase [Mycobacteriales bacterium]
MPETTPPATIPPATLAASTLAASTLPAATPAAGSGPAGLPDGTAGGGALPRRAWVEQVMGLPVSVHVRGDAARSAAVARAVAELYRSLRRDDERFSTYRAGSEVSALRRGELAVPSPDMREVLRLCGEARARTGGAFDADLPTGFDPSGLVKGWAVERAAAPLRVAAAGSDWLVNAGGDILLHAEAGRAWLVGVEDPRHRATTLGVARLRRGAIATSGGAHRGAHIIDPGTGGPVRHGVLAATVVAPTLLWADVYATAAYVRGEQALGWLRRTPGIRALLVRADGTLVSTANVGGPAPG